MKSLTSRNDKKAVSNKNRRFLTLNLFFLYYYIQIKIILLNNFLYYKYQMKIYLLLFLVNYLLIFLFFDVFIYDLIFIIHMSKLINRSLNWFACVNLYFSSVGRNEYQISRAGQTPIFSPFLGNTKLRLGPYDFAS